MTTPADLPAGHAPTAAELATYKTSVTELQTNPVMASDSAGGTTTSTSYTNSLDGIATPLSVSFVAAKTSMVVVVGSMITQQTSGPWNQYMAPVVTGDSYSYGPNDTDAAIGQFSSDNVGCYVEKSTVVSGLTIGATYTVTPEFHGGGVQCTFSNRRIVVHQ